MDEDKNHVIDFVFYKGISLPSRLVRWKNNSEFSHVEVIVEGNETFGAFSKGVMHSKIDWHKKGTPYQIYRIHVTEQQNNIFWEFMKAQEGKKYDWFGVFGYIDSSIKENKERWYCSELCYCGLLEAGIMLYNRILKYPSPFAISISKDLKLIKEGIVGEEKANNEEELVENEN